MTVTGCLPQRTYEDIKGRVAGFGDDGQTLIIEHEDIPGLMPAMTMSFKLREAPLPETLNHGDAVAFTLVVRQGESWIEDLESLPDDAVAQHPAGEPDPFYSDAPLPLLLQPGDTLPEALLIDHQNQPLALSSFRGRFLALTFIYTRCPLPDYCPLLSRNFQLLQPTLKEEHGDRVHLLSITFDPAHDTPEVLRTYAARYTGDLEGWTFATGTDEEIRGLATRFGVTYETEGDQIIHNLATALIDAEGRILEIWRGNTWQPDDLLQTLAAAR